LIQTPAARFVVDPQYLADTVDVPLDQMTVDPVAGRQGQLEVDRSTGGGSVERGTATRLVGDGYDEFAGLGRLHRQPDTVQTDGAPGNEWDGWIDSDPQGVLADFGNGRGGLDTPCEHGFLPVGEGRCQAPITRDPVGSEQERGITAWPRSLPGHSAPRGAGGPGITPHRHTLESHHWQ
jgi:hypothetical protein